MKRSILFGIVGIAAAMVTSSSYGQGAILLGNYISSSNIPSQIMLGGSPISTGGYTVGIYWVAGNVVGSVSADPTGIANPATLGGGLAVGTGLGSTAALVGSGFGYPGAYLAGNVFVTGLAASSVITVEVVAYNGPSYLDPLTTFRGHSSAFAMTTTSAPDRKSVV